MKFASKSILEAANGAILERANYELDRVMSNINDENTHPTKARTITITLKFVPTDDRKQIDMYSESKSKLEATKPVKTTLFNVQDIDKKTGEVMHVLREALEVSPGQMDIHGNIQAEPEIFVFGKDADRVANERKGAYLTWNN